MRRRAWLVWWPVVAVLLGACSGPAVRQPGPGTAAALEAMAQRERELDARPNWSLEGRVAIRNGGEGGSGALEWVQRGAAFRVTLRAPVTGQGWRLEVVPGHARLEGLEGGPREDVEADRLLREALGLEVPTARLVRWLRGQRGGGEAEVRFGPAGLPETMVEAGWRIEYRDWFTTADPPLPRRIEARSGERRLRLVVQRWGEDPGD